MNAIRLNDGTEYPVVWCGAADGVLCAELKTPMTVSFAAGIFGDSARTSGVTYLIGGTAAGSFAGYTTLLGVQRDRWNGRVTVQLEKAAVTDMIGEIEIEIIDLEPEEE